MEQAIKFRLLTDQLSDKEFQTFISKLTKSQGGRKFIETALFTHFNQYDQHLDGVINSVSNIIQSRKDKKNKIIKYDCIDKLPSILINHIASFLNFYSYLSFQSTNRSIYYASNSPFSLQSLPKKLSSKYPVTQLITKYKCIKKLAINIKYFNTLSFQNKLTWKYSNIHTLSLSNYGGNQLELDTFLNGNFINFDNVKTLELTDFHCNAQIFCNKLLFKFTNIEFLYLNHIKLRNYDAVNINDNDLRKLFPKLRGFSCTDSVFGRLASQIINSLSNKLESLHLNYHEISPLNINDDVTFNNLKECMCFFNNKLLKRILKNTPSLTSIIIGDVNAKDLRERIKDAMSQNSLESLNVMSKFDCVVPIMKQLELSLFDNSIKKSKNILSVRIESIAGFKNECVYEMSLLTTRVINMLKAVVNKFRFQISLETDMETDHGQDVINSDNDLIKKWIKLITSTNDTDYIAYAKAESTKMTGIVMKKNMEYRVFQNIIMGFTSTGEDLFD